MLAAQGMNRLSGSRAELSELDFTHIQAAFEERDRGDDLAVADRGDPGEVTAVLCASSDKHDDVVSVCQAPL
ncbi:hypothetical protein [Streptomyces sp. NBC_00019]|uniref:hypothetical protein n=1 Tax=Streptomyces sp. NBC_00019 TaxID=2975623 RepID=UPI003243796C